MSIPAPFRRVLEAGDPNWKSGENPNLVIVYGGKTRRYLECFTMDAIADVESRIMKRGRGDPRRKAMSQLYITQAVDASVDDTGRLVLPKNLRDKIDLSGVAYFAGNGDTFEIWKPETHEAEMDAELQADDDFDPDTDASAYLDGDEGV